MADTPSELHADYRDKETLRILGWKTCPVCHATFKQRKPPKAVQTFCSWLCYLNARSTT